MERQKLAGPDIAFFLQATAASSLAETGRFCPTHPASVISWARTRSTYHGPLTLTLKNAPTNERPLTAPSRHCDSLLTHFPDRDPQPTTRPIV